MRNIIGGALLTLTLLFPAAAARAQYYEVPPVDFTAFLSHPRYEQGGFFTAFEFLYLRSENVLGNQDIAVRGLVDIDGSITGGQPGTFLGSGDVALNTRQITGRQSYVPGFNITMGWRFESGVAVMLSWWHLVENRLHAEANILPRGLAGGAQLENTFLTSPVFNYPLSYGGNPRNVLLGNDGATLGIWNAASQMSISWLSRFEMVELTTRIPIYQTDSDRCYGTFGPRAVVMWERFKWRAVDQDLVGFASPSTVANYSNVVSNRLYGPFVGWGYEKYLGSTPVGAFSVSIDVDAGLYLDFVKMRARYELEDQSTAATRSRNSYTIAPGLQGKLGFWWYPWEAITVHFAWDGLVFFNTVASPKPVDFNFGSIDPEYDHTFRRFIHGINVGVGLVF